MDVVNFLLLLLWIAILCIQLARGAVMHGQLINQYSRGQKAHPLPLSRLDHGIQSIDVLTGAVQAGVP